MTAGDDRSKLFKRDVYQKSFEEISSLKARFPQDVVHVLAREVLVRLSAHFEEKHHAISPQQVEELAFALIDNDPDAATRLVFSEQAAGTSLKTLYLSYLGAAARLLGEWWDLDRVTFVQVIAGTGRIYAIMRGLRPLFEAEDPIRTDKSALFATVPSESHVLGIRMVTDLMRQQGWDIDLEVGLQHDQLLEVILNSNKPIIGLSAGGVHTLAELAKLVIAIRLGAPKKLILVSGPIVEESREEVQLMGVDATATSYDGAVEELDMLWARLTRAA